MNNLTRIQVIDNIVDYLSKNDYHVEVETSTGGVLLVNASRTSWIPFSQNARTVPKKQRHNLVIALYENEDHEQFLLVCLPGELRTSYKVAKDWL